MKENYIKKVFDLFNSSGMTFTEEEINSVEFADFGLDHIEIEGLNLIVYVNNDLYCAKEMALLPHQFCPEHRHPDIGKKRGKKETFRCREGLVYLFVEGQDNGLIDRVKLPKGKEAYYTVRKGIKLLPGEQYTIPSNTKHWFVAGEQGAVISEFSSPSDDASDIFTDPSIVRV